MRRVRFAAFAAAMVLGAALALLAAVGLCAAATGLRESADDVTLTQQALYGDPAAAEGLQVVSRTQCGWRLYWDTSFAVERQPRPTVSLQRYAIMHREPGGQRTGEGLSLYPYTSGGGSSSGGIDLESWEQEDFYSPFASLAPVFRDVDTRAPAGREYTETVRLADYFEWYPLIAEVDISAPEVWIMPEQPQARQKDLDACFMDFFRIPVPQEHLVTVTLDKDRAGTLQSFDVFGGSEDTPELYSRSLVGEQAVWFTFHRDERLDFSHVPGGYGIYALPYERTDDTAYASQNVTAIHPERLANVWPLADGVQVEDLSLSPEGVLLLVTREDGWLCLSQFLPGDRPEAPLRLLAQEKLLPLSPEDYVEGTVCFEDCLLVCGAGRFALLQWDADCYRPVLSGDAMEAEQLGMSIPYGADMAFSWDGERLAVGQYQSSRGYENCCDLYLAVFTADGLQYAGQIGTTLSRNEGTRQHSRVQPAEVAPLTLAWK